MSNVHDQKLIERVEWHRRDAAYAAQKAARDSKSAQPDKAVKEAILAQYSGAVEESSDDEDADGDGGDLGDEVRIL